MVGALSVIAIRRFHSAVYELEVTELHRPGQHCVGECLSAHSARREGRLQSLRRSFSGSRKGSHPGHRGVTHLPMNGGPVTLRTFFVGLPFEALPFRVAVVAFHRYHHSSPVSDKFRESPFSGSLNKFRRSCVLSETKLVMGISQRVRLWIWSQSAGRGRCRVVLRRWPGPTLSRTRVLQDWPLNVAYFKSPFSLS